MFLVFRKQSCKALIIFGPLKYQRLWSRLCCCWWRCLHELTRTKSHPWLARDRSQTLPRGWSWVWIWRRGLHILSEALLVQVCPCQNSLTCVCPAWSPGVGWPICSIMGCLWEGPRAVTVLPWEHFSCGPCLPNHHLPPCLLCRCSPHTVPPATVYPCPSGCS